MNREQIKQNAINNWDSQPLRDLKLVALNNPFDKFKLVFCQYIQSAVLDFYFDQEDFETANKYLNTPPARENRYRNAQGFIATESIERSPYANKLNLELAKEVYEELSLDK